MHLLLILVCAPRTFNLVPASGDVESAAVMLMFTDDDKQIAMSSPGTANPPRPPARKDLQTGGRSDSGARGAPALSAPSAPPWERLSNQLGIWGLGQFHSSCFNPNTARFDFQVAMDDIDLLIQLCSL